MYDEKENREKGILPKNLLDEEKDDLRIMKSV